MIFRYIRFFLLILITIVFVAFSVANREMVEINLFPIPYSANMPKFILAILCFSLGVIVAGLIMSLKLARARHRLNKEHKRAVTLETELKGLRSENLLPAATRRQA